MRPTERWSSHLLHPPNPNTRHLYGLAAQEFCAFCTRLGAPLDHVPSPTVAAWVQALAAKGKSAATVNGKLSGVRQWLDRLAWHGVIKGNPGRQVLQSILSRQKVSP